MWRHQYQKITFLSIEGAKIIQESQKFPWNWHLLYFIICGWFQLKTMSRSRVLNSFSSLLKDCSFRWFRAKKCFLNTLGWLKFLKNFREAIFFKEWTFSEQLILSKTSIFLSALLLKTKLQWNTGCNLLCI